MSYAPPTTGASGASYTTIYSGLPPPQPDYSSSELEGTSTDTARKSSIADYSDHDRTNDGYSSAASFDFSGAQSAAGPYRRSSTSQRMGTTPPYARPRYTADSQSPTSQIYTSQQSQAGSVVSPTATSPTSSTAGQQYQRIARFVGPPPVALACTECRSRHLKCDAGTPQCSRCLADKRDCTYVKSRRGWKGTRRKKVQSSTGESSKSGAALQSGTDTEGPDGGYSSGKSVLNIGFFFFVFSSVCTFLHVSVHGRFHGIGLSMWPLFFPVSSRCYLHAVLLPGISAELLRRLNMRNPHAEPDATAMGISKPF